MTFPLASPTFGWHRPDDFRWTEVAPVHPYEVLTSGGIDTDFFLPTALPNKVAPDLSKSELSELSHRTTLAGGQRMVIGLRLLHHQPHAFDEITGVGPQSRL